MQFFYHIVWFKIYFHRNSAFSEKRHVILLYTMYNFYLQNFIYNEQGKDILPMIKFQAPSLLT